MPIEAPTRELVGSIDVWGFLMEAPLPIAVVGCPDFVYLLSNAANQRLAGGRELVGRRVADVFPEIAESGLVERLERVYATGEPYTTEEDRVSVTSPDGARRDRFLAGACQPLRDARGRIVAILTLAYDVTDQVLARNEAERLRARAEEACRLKDEFLATISHELRTPLSSILGWATLLRQHAVESTAFERGLSVIERNARAQLRIVEDILDIARIVRGEMRLKRQTVDVAAIAREVIESIKPAADAKGLSLHVSTPADVCIVLADPDRLRQVLWNLVANAVKFTPESGRVALEVESHDSRLTVAVTDTGRGMDPGFVPHAFDPFRQAEPSTTRATGGLGLGLAIVRHIVEAHGGTVRADSPGVGKGSTFLVELPLASITRATDDARNAKQNDGPPERRLEGVRVLVVEDDLDGRELVELTLEREGATVACAASAEEALDVVARFDPSAIVSDVGMPERDGYWLAAELRRRRPTLPLVALTAFGRAEDVARARAAGFDVHLAKPVEPRELVAALAGLAARS